MKNNIDPKHQQKKNALKTIGPIVLIIGLVFTIIGLGSFFSSFAAPFKSFGGMHMEFHGPRYFWCAFIGLPLIGFGIKLTAAGYSSEILRYGAQETAPVAKDTFNYMAKGTKEGIKDISSAIHEGISYNNDSTIENHIICTKCGSNNHSDSKFCNNCGTELSKTKLCRSCGKENDSSAKFCNNCGQAF